MMSHEQIVRIAEAKEEALESIKKFAVLSGMASSDTATNKQILHSALDFILQNIVDDEVFSANECDLAWYSKQNLSGDYDWVLARLIRAIYMPWWLDGYSKHYVEIELDCSDYIWRARDAVEIFQAFGFAAFLPTEASDVMVIVPNMKMKEYYMKNIWPNSRYNSINKNKQ